MTYRSLRGLFIAAPISLMVASCVVAPDEEFVSPSNFILNSESPGFPVEISVSNIDATSARISWTAPNSFGTQIGRRLALSSYELQYADNVQFNDPTTYFTANTELLVRGLSPSKTYYVRVRTRNTNELKTRQVSPFGTLSSPQSFFTTSAIGPLTAPTGVVVAVSSSTVATAQVSWERPASQGADSQGIPATITHYKVEYSQDVNFTNKREKDQISAQTVEIDGLTGANTRYYVRVTAYNSLGDSSSATASFFTPDLSVAPGQATIVKIEKAATDPKTEIYLEWNAPQSYGRDGVGAPASISPTTPYRVEYSMDQNFPASSTQMQTLNNGIGNTTITQLTPSKTYYFRVVVINSAGNTSTSVPGSATLDSAAEAPGMFTPSVAANGNTLVVTWSAPTNTGKNADGTTAVISGYEVRYSTNQADLVAPITGTPDSTKGSAAIPLNTNGANNYTYTTPSLSAATDYYIVVITSNGTNISSNSVPNPDPTRTP